MNNFWRGKKVLITGHSGFKGSWLSIWLKSMGASVIGFSLHNDEKASWIFRGFNEKEGSYRGDILNPSQIKKVSRSKNLMLCFIWQLKLWCKSHIKILKKRGM